MTILLDSREPPDPHPWVAYWPADVVVARGTLETGDMALAGAPGLAVVERKTVADFVAAIGGQRERFTRELLRARYCGAFCIIVEGSLSDVLMQGRDLHPSAILGSIAAWTRRGFPALFCDNQRQAATLALKFIMQPIGEAERLLRATSKNSITANTRNP